MHMYTNIKRSCTFVDLRHLCVRDSLLCVFMCTLIPINSNGWLGHLIGPVDCDVTGPLWRHQKAVSCLGGVKSISDTRRLSRTPGCARQVNHVCFVASVCVSAVLSYNEIFPWKDCLYISTRPYTGFSAHVVRLCHLTLFGPDLHAPVAAEAHALPVYTLEKVDRHK